MKRAEVFYPPVTQIVELDGVPQRGVKWGLWAYWLDGSLAKRDDNAMPPLEQPRQVAGVGAGVVAEKEMEGAEVQALRDQLHQDFDDKVMRDEIPATPPVRGGPEIGYAKLT